MTSQIMSLPLPRHSALRGHHHAWSSQRTSSLRSYDHGIEAGQSLSLPILATSAQPARILVVDDLHTTGPLVYLLHGLGYWATRVTSSGETALDLAQDFSPSIVLLTLQLPEMSAYRLAARLRDQATGRTLRLIALIDDYAQTDRDLAREAGFERYLAKPVRSGALQQLLQAKRS
jgi:CheY-like chemotaxis protein